MWDGEDLVTLGAAAGLGLLVGLQRERTGHTVAGFRTFALITLLGAVCALLSREFGGWIVGAGMLGLSGVVVAGAILAAGPTERAHPGITTEVGAVVMFAVGALTAVNMTAAVAGGVGVAVLLQAKDRLHGLAARIGEADMRAVLQFAAATFVVLPLLPDEGLGPYGVLNPRKIWLLVVLVVGISLGAYVAYKLLGPGGGTLAGGLLGGVISSTATTVSYARRAHEADGEPAAVRAAGVVILLATSVVYARVLVEIGVVAPSLLREAAWPIAIMLVASLSASAVAWRRTGASAESPPPRGNPSELRGALVFAALFSVVLVAVEWSTRQLGGAGLYAVAVVSGTVDMDAITLSTSRMSGAGELGAAAAWRAVVLASMSNLVVKWAIAWSLGGQALAWRLLPYFGAIAVVGAGLIAAWPDAPGPRGQPAARTGTLGHALPVR